MVFTLRRTAARVVVINTASNEVFLMAAHDPAHPEAGSWWEIPGGGIDPGETSADAAARELVEEAGIHDAEVGPVVWTQHADFMFGGYHFDQDEFIHVAYTTNSTAYAPEGLESLEALAFEGARWWPIDEFMAADVKVLPIHLRQFLPALAKGEIEDPPPHVGDV